MIVSIICYSTVMLMVVATAADPVDIDAIDSPHGVNMIDDDDDEQIKPVFPRPIDRSVLPISKIPDIGQNRLYFVYKKVLIESSPAYSFMKEFMFLVRGMCPMARNDSDFDIVIEKNILQTSKINPTDSTAPPPTRYLCGDASLPMPYVFIVNSTEFDAEIVKLSNASMSNVSCALVNFFAVWCPFSAQLAPFFNAVPRAVPELTVLAVNIRSYSRLNTRYGIVGTPTVMLFHNGKAVARFNDTQYSLSALNSFVERFTNLTAKVDVDVEDSDLFGPLLSKPIRTFDIWLTLSWLTIFVGMFYGVLRTKFAQQIIESLVRNWREANEL